MLKRKFPEAGFRRFLYARTISIFGDRFSELGIPLVVLAVSGSPGLAGGAAAAIQLSVPTAFFFGPLVDEGHHRRLMVAADTCRAVLLTVFALNVMLGGRAFIILLLSFSIGICDVAFAVSASSTLRSLVPDNRELVRANSAIEAGDATSTIAGPIAAGAVISWLGAQASLIVDAATFALSAWLLRGLRGVEVATVRAGPSKWEPKQLLAGAFVAWKDPRQRLLQVAVVAFNAMSASVVLLVVVLGKEVLGLSAGETGVILAAAGAGGLIAALAVAPRLTGLSLPAALAGVLLMAAVAVIGLSRSDGMLEAACWNLLLDGSLATGFVLSSSARIAITEKNLLGRLSGASYIVTSQGRGLAVLLTGLGIQAFGARATLVANAVMLTAAAAVVKAISGMRGAELEWERS